MLLRVAALAALAIFAAPQANAGELEYLQLLNMRGIMVVDTALMLHTGYVVCDALNDDTGDTIIAQLIMGGDITPSHATAIVLSAVEGLCPWHDHRRGVMA